MNHNNKRNSNNKLIIINENKLIIKNNNKRINSYNK